MSDMRYMKILKLCPASQMFHFYTTTRRYLLSANASKGRERESKMEEDIVYCGSCILLHAHVWTHKLTRVHVHAQL